MLFPHFHHDLHSLPLSLSLAVPQVWCLSGGHQINRTVDGAVQSILLTGLLPDTRYAVAVAAVTSLGVGAHSPPVSLLLSESPELSGGAALSALRPLFPSAVRGVARIGRAYAPSVKTANCYSAYRRQAVKYAARCVFSVWTHDRRRNITVLAQI